MRHDGWLGDGRVLRDIDRRAAVPAVLINGRFDSQPPLATAWEAHRRWPASRLVVVDDAGHAADYEGIAAELVRAMDGFAGRHS